MRYLLLLMWIAPLVAQPKGTLLDSLTWIEAERVLTGRAVVVIPLGAQSKEHGPHLLLRNDFLIAEYLTKRVLEQADVVVAPPVNYSFYPAFLEYPGSTSLELDTARDVIVDICRGLSRFGPRRFYVLNTGVSTLAALRPAAAILAAHGILMRYTDVLHITGDVERSIKQQAGGTHADEMETSMMLYIAPETVTMKKAVKDYHEGIGGLTRDPKGPGTYSASGIWGDPTLATREKGEKLTEATVSGTLREIEALRTAPLPERTIDRLPADRYTGEYRTRAGKTVQVTAVEGRLFIQTPVGRTTPLSPITEQRFTTGAMPVNFYGEEGSPATSLTLWFEGKEVRATRKPR